MKSCIFKRKHTELQYGKQSRVWILLMKLAMHDIILALFSCGSVCAAFVLYERKKNACKKAKCSNKKLHRRKPVVWNTVLKRELKKSQLRQKFTSK